MQLASLQFSICRRTHNLPLAVCFLLFPLSPAFAQQPKLIVQTGHAASVLAAAFSPDGKILASASHDKTIKLWEVNSGKELGTFTGHSEPVLSIAFSPDGKTLASGSNDRTIKLWEVETGNELLTMSASSSLGITHLAFTSDGKTLASVSRDGSIVLWQVATGNEISLVSKEAFEARVAVFSPDSKILASAGRSGTITLWEAGTGVKLRSWAGHSNSVLSLCFSSEGKNLMSVGKDSTIKQWEAGTGKELRTLAHSGSMRSAAFSTEGKFVAIGSGSEEGAITLWEINAGRKIQARQEPAEAVRFVAFSPDGKTLASGSGDETVTLWEAGSGKKLRSLHGQAGFINSIAFSPDGNTLACANNGTTVKLWNFRSGREFRVLAGHDSEINTVALSPEGKTLAGGSVDGAITLWDIGNGEKLRTLNEPIDDYTTSSTYNYSALAFSPEGKILAHDTNAGIKLWEIDTGEELEEFATGNLIVYSIAFSPDAKSLAAGVGDQIKLWRLRTGKEARSQSGGGLPVRAVAFSPDGKFLSSGNGDGEVTLWEAATLKEIYSVAGHSEAVNAVAFSPNGKILASGSNDHSVKLWDASTGKELEVLTGHSDAVTTVAFAPNGKFVASGSRDAKIKLWDNTSGKEAATLIGLDAQDWVVVAHNGRFDASLEGLQNVHYVQDNQLIPVEAFFERFYTPKLLARVFSGEEESGTASALDLNRAFKLPPLVKIISPKTGENFTTDTIDLIVEALDQGGGIDEIRLYQNGKLLSESQRNVRPKPEPGDKFRRSFLVTLVAGRNELEAIALNTDRTESLPDSIRLELQAAVPESRLHILAVGINAYQNAGLNLNYGKPDAQAFTLSLEKSGKGIFKQILKQELYDEHATKAEIEAAFNAISGDAQPQDVFVFFYAGHGIISQSEAGSLPEFYLVTHEVTKLYSEGGMLAGKGLSARQLQEFCVKIKAQKQLVVLDACQAGGAVEAFAVRGAAEEKAIVQLARSTGVVVLAASGTKQFATEFVQLGHGVFTYALLQGLAGEADGGVASDGKITVKELEAYLNDKVPELTKKYHGAAQYPNSYARGQDFPLGVLK